MNMNEVYEQVELVGFHNYKVDGVDRAKLSCLVPYPVNEGFGKKVAYEITENLAILSSFTQKVPCEVTLVKKMTRNYKGFLELELVGILDGWNRE